MKNKTKITYRCEFIFHNEIRYVTSDRGIERFVNGFWINEEGKLTTGEDARFWIPPNKIEYIAKDFS